MPTPEPSLFEEIDAATEDEALRAAEADVKAGRLISHEAMSRWLRSWGTPNELPPPECDV
jgi:predicted transcriptional regulator